ncbi:MAG: hypothetical protein ACRCTQ_01625 [Brevinemataceae bacterium]
MIKLLQILFSIFIGLSLFFIYQNVSIPQTKWTNNTPYIFEVFPDSAKFIFSVSQPSTIYWRVCTSDQPAPKATDMTNPFSLSKTALYGGTIIQNSISMYTNNISPLSPEQSYKIYTIAVPIAGNFPNNITEIKFSTPPK